MKRVSVMLEFEIDGHKAVGFKIDDSDVIWLPKSQIFNLEALLDAEPTYKEKVSVEIPEWLAIKKGLDPYCEEVEDEVH